MPLPFIKSGNNERGAVLIVCLLLLVILTLLGVTSMQSTALEEKMARNMRLRDMAFQAAEAGLRDGETSLQSAAPADFGNKPGLYKASAGNTPSWNDASTWDASSSLSLKATNALSFATSDASIKVSPRYFIEDMGPVNTGSQNMAADVPTAQSEIYRITSCGAIDSGSQVLAEVVLQSTFVQ